MIHLVSATPIEHEYYCQDNELRTLCDSVGNMIEDLLEDDDFHLTIVLAMNDVENPSVFSMAFSGTTLGLDFYPDVIEVTDFDEEGGTLLNIFDRNEVGKATVWLVNKITQNS